jgi:hypothetical protein
MFCPKCAGQNLDGASYCRVCGANISLVPQALTGQLPTASEDCLSGWGKRDRKKQGKGSLESAFRSAFMGIGFLFVALALSFSRMGQGWWFWMMIPAFSMMGTGVAQYIRIKEQERRAMMAGGINKPSLQAAPRVESIPSRNTGSVLAPPPSVTEGTTRHLGAEAPTRTLDAADELPK